MMNEWSHITFMYPWVLAGLFLIPLLALWYAWRYLKRLPLLRVSGGGELARELRSFRTIAYHSLFGLRMLALGAVIIALARPVLPQYESEVETRGINIVLALDVSSSMLARDFSPDRLEAAKELAKEFISERDNDRIGLVVFAGEAFTQCPVTIDHKVLLHLLDEIKTGMLEDGTAIGSGLGTAVNRLKDSEGNSKVVILLTDGVNNSGEIDPVTAAELAVNYGIRVYTIGVGSAGKALSPVAKRPDGTLVFDYVKVEIDEDLLKQIANMTGGQYFRATNKESLREIYREIDRMEKSRVQVSTIPRPIDKFHALLWLAILFLGIEHLLRFSWLRTFTS